MSELLCLTKDHVEKYAVERNLEGVAVLVTGVEEDGYTWLPLGMAERIMSARGNKVDSRVGKPEWRDGRIIFNKVPYGIVVQANLANGTE